MGSRLVGVLAFITFIHFGARAAAPATVFEVSDFLTPSTLPMELDHLVEATSECSLLVVFDPACPACARAAQLQTEKATLPLDVVWVAEDETAKDQYAARIHPQARVEVAPAAHDALMVRAVPAAFVVSNGVVISQAAITGAEDLGRVATQCAAPSDA
jgi:hypothetical protein